MATNDIQPMRVEPELNLLLSKSDLDQPLWKSLVQNLDDFFFPKKLPPLVLTSKAIPVKGYLGILQLQEKRRAGFDCGAHSCGTCDHWGNHAGPTGGAADYETSRGGDADRA